MLDVRSKSGVRELHERIANSAQKLRPFRESRTHSIRQAVAGGYAEARDPDDLVIVQLLGQTVETYSLLLTGGEAKTKVTTAERTLKAVGRRLETALNTVSREIHLTETLRLATIDAFYRMGIVKIYQAEGRQAEAENDVWIEIGFPYVKRVGFDDFGYDMSRSRWSEIRYCWDEYELPKESLLDDDFYNRSVVKKLEARLKGDGERRADELSRDFVDDPAALESYVTLMDVWLPERGEIAVMSRYDDSLLPLAIVEWEGRTEGPYERLLLSDVPDNIMPVGIIDQLKPIHMTINRLARKIIYQGENQKTVPWYEQSAKQDAQLLRGAQDLELIKVVNRDGLGTFEFGGVNQGGLALFGRFMELYDRMAGNLSSLAGLGPQAGTLGQEELIYGQASKKLSKYAEKVLTFADNVITAVAHLVWIDDENEIRGELQDPILGGADYSWSPKYRQGEFLDYAFKIEPHSLTYESPQAKLMKLERFIGTFMQMWPAVQEAGGALDVQEMVAQYAELGNMEALKTIITFNNEIASTSRAGERAKQAPQTTRENIRTSVSAGPTERNRNRMMTDLLMSQQQPNQPQGAVSLGGER